MGALGLKGLGLLLAFLRVLGFWGFGVKGLGVLGLKGLGSRSFGDRGFYGLESC